MATVSQEEPVDFSAIERAAERIATHAHATPVLRSCSLDELAGAALFFKCENFQRAGAFKFRGACNAVWSLSDVVASNGVVTHSSGNHGAALALAARTRGIPAHVVVPEGANRSKVEAIVEYGAILHRCAPSIDAREHAAAEVSLQTGATLVHPYTSASVIAGQGTVALDLLREVGSLDALIAPVGGGGLISGTAIAAGAIAPQTIIYAAEPAGAADTFASMQQGKRIDDFVPDTLCDGLRALVGEVNLAILMRHGVRVLTVTDNETIAAMRLIWQRLKIVVEPSSAIVLAALLKHRDLFAGRRVGLILSGGNVDLDALPWMH